MASPRRWSLATVLTAAGIAAGIACGGDGGTGPKDPQACNTTVGTILIGQTVTGALTTASCQLADDTFADPWTLQVSVITTLTLDLGSTAFDAFLFVRDASGNLVVQDDDSGPDFDARIVHTFGPGTYIVYANAFDVGDVGGYTLSVAAPPPP